MESHGKFLGEVLKPCTTHADYVRKAHAPKETRTSNRHLRILPTLSRRARQAMHYGKAGTDTSCYRHCLGEPAKQRNVMPYGKAGAPNKLTYLNSPAKHYTKFYTDKQVLSGAI